MGKKRITTKEGEILESQDQKSVALPKSALKKKISSANLYVKATFNNTILTLTDKAGNTISQASAGSLGFKGTKKSTSFAASKVGERIGAQAEALGIKDVDIYVKGIGHGRETAIKSFMSYNIDVKKICDVTPIPHNGPKPKKPRRV